MSQLVVFGESVSFTCGAIAFPAPSYSWSTPIPNSDFNTSTITVIIFMAISYYGNYTCMANSNGTVVESQPALLTGMLAINFCCTYVRMYVCMYA